MNKYFKILTAFLLITANTVLAQNNALKTGLSDALTGYMNLSYERKINETQSLLFKFGYMQPTRSPFISEETLTPDPLTMEDANGGINTSIEYRFYVAKKKSPHGLYLGPYFRYFNQALKYTDEIDDRIFNVDLNSNSFGIGGIIGHQVIISDIIVLDFSFFGAGVDLHNIKFQYQSQQPGEEFDYSSIEGDIREVFKDIDYLEKKLNFTPHNDKLITKLPFLFPGFRIGVSAGIAF